MAFKAIISSFLNLTEAYYNAFPFYLIDSKTIASLFFNLSEA
jgi:hypothetical protein